MRNNLFATAAVLSLVGILSSFPAWPVQARCNLMHDLRPTNPSDPTSADPAKPTVDFNSNKPVDAATKDEILKNIMETGIPCQETVTGDGPERAKKTQLQHRQRGFDFYSWLTFLALNSPADGYTRIDKSMPNTKTMWEDRKNFKQLLDVMLQDGAASKWEDAKKAPPGCESEFKPDTDMGIEMIEEVYNQPFKTGALIDQQGNYALFDILMNKDMFDYIQAHKLYSKAGQQSAENAKLKVDFPAGVNPPKGQIEGGHPGGIIIKVSWKILDSEAEKRKFHTVDAVISMPHHDPNTKPTCVRKTLGLVGFHVMHKTVTRLQWIWTSFEHVDNVPEQSEIRKQKTWNFYKVCNTWTCPAVNQTPPRPWEPKPALGLKFDGTFRSQIVRTTPLTEETKKMNRKFQEIVRGSVWENYMLLSTQWPSGFPCAQKTTHEPPAQPLPDTDLEKEPDMNCAPAPTFLANSTLETYSQGDVPLASSSCMACHGNATSYQSAQADQFGPNGKLKAKFFNQTDFTFMLEKARGPDAPNLTELYSRPLTPEPSKRDARLDDPAIREQDNRIEIDPNDAAAFYKRGLLYAQHGDWSRAIKDFDDAIRLNPRDAEALNNRCWAHAIVEELQQALRDCNEALLLNPRYTDAHDSRGLIYLKSGQLTNALADYDAALRANPNNASSLYGRGIAKLRSGNTVGGNADIAAAKVIKPAIAEEFAGYGIR